MQIKPSTKQTYAVIEISPEQQKEIEQIMDEAFLKVRRLPKGLRLRVSADEALSDSANVLSNGSILEIK